MLDCEGLISAYHAERREIQAREAAEELRVSRENHARVLRGAASSGIQVIIFALFFMMNLSLRTI